MGDDVVVVTEYVCVVSASVYLCVYVAFCIDFLQFSLRIKLSKYSKYIEKLLVSLYLLQNYVFQPERITF